MLENGDANDDDDEGEKAKERNERERVVLFLENKREMMNVRCQ